MKDNFLDTIFRISEKAKLLFKHNVSKLVLYYFEYHTPQIGLIFYENVKWALQALRCRLGLIDKTYFIDASYLFYD